MEVIEEKFNVRFIEHFRPELFSKNSGLKIEDIIELFSFPYIKSCVDRLNEKSELSETLNEINLEAFVFFITLLYTYIIKNAPYIPDKELINITITKHTRNESFDEIVVKYEFD